jgi:hypothetical protein
MLKFFINLLFLEKIHILLFLASLYIPPMNSASGPPVLEKNIQPRRDMN